MLRGDLTFVIFNFAKLTHSEKLGRDNTGTQTIRRVANAEETAPDQAILAWKMDLAHRGNDAHEGRLDVCRAQKNETNRRDCAAVPVHLVLFCGTRMR